jgi:hypothetical protein
MTGHPRTISLLQRSIMAVVVGSASMAAAILASAWAFWLFEGGESEVPAIILAIAVPFLTPLFLRAFLPGGWSPLGTGLGALLAFALWWTAVWSYLGPRYGWTPPTFAALFPLTSLGAFAASRPRRQDVDLQSGIRVP